MKKQNSLWLIVCSLALFGCAKSVPPTDLLSTTEVTVRGVETAETMSTAPLEVKKAREQLDKAKVEMEKKNYILARRLAEQSLADAQLAQAKTNAEKMKLVAEDDVKGIETLRRETRRKSPQ